MSSVEEADSWIGRTAVDINGEKIGRITKIWVDDHSGEPVWASVTTSLLARQATLVPLDGVAASGRAQQFAYSRAEVRNAPRIDEDGHLELDDEWRLFTYYDLAGTGDPTTQPRGLGLDGTR